MKNVIIILLMMFFTLSCSSNRDLKGKKYTYKSKNRELVIKFNENNTCSIKNVFLCNDIDDEFREIIINATYKRYNDMIVFRNFNCKDDGCIYPSYIEIPAQNSSNCIFLNKDERKNTTIFDGRTFQSDYYKYGLVPNIDIDTMYIVKNKIIFTKKTESGSFGFVFSK